MEDEQVTSTSPMSKKNAEAVRILVRRLTAHPFVAQDKPVYHFNPSPVPHLY
jgi:hypothetical protein